MASSKVNPGGSNATSSFSRTTSFLRRHLWLRPVIAACILGIIGWWVRGNVEESMRERMAAEVTTIRDADVVALRYWLREQQINSSLLAQDPAMAEPIRAIVAHADAAKETDAALLQAPDLRTLRDRLAPKLKMLNYVDFLVVNSSARVLASREDAAIGKTLEPGMRRHFFEKVLRGQAAVSRPYRSPMMLPDAKGVMKAGQPTMWTAAPVLDQNQKPVAALGLRIPPEGAFTEILHVAQAGETGETYAFDQAGMLLSSSRFDDDLKRVGLVVDRPDERSLLNLEVRDPGVNMMKGDRPTKPRNEQPLTRMAADAVAGNKGVDVRGYRDYRGVPSIGAWTWLPEYGFGVATEMDVAEAYRPLYVLRYTFWGIFALLALTAIAMLAYMTIAERHRRALRRAVLASRQLGQYTLEEKIGSGGMGTVYRARHALLRRPTAIKLLDGAVSDTAIARFEREVQTTSQLNHPNTIAVYDYGKTAEGVFYYAMEYLDGINLDDLVSKFGPQKEGRVIAILQQVCGALAEAHDAGLIHRDIKPANIILTRRGGLPDFVKVVDFGLVKTIGGRDGKLTASDAVTGTPLYLSPEAIDTPEFIDARTDIYAIGAVGYYLITGTPVFQASTLVEACMNHLHKAPEPPSQRLGRPVNASVEAVLLRCLAKKPDNRPQNVRALADELGRCQIEEAWTPEQAETWWKKAQASSQWDTLRPSAKETGVKDDIGKTIVFIAEGTR